MSLDHTSGEARSASIPPESVDNRMSLSNAFRVLQCECLRDESAHRPSHYTRALETERLDYMRGIVSKLRNVEWLSVVRGAADAAVVEQDEFVGRRESDQ